MLAGLLVAVAIANTLGTSFSVGKQVRTILPGSPANTLEQPGTFTFYEDIGFLASAPQRDGDLLGLFKRLRREGIQAVGWNSNETTEPDFSQGGISALALIANLATLPEGISEQQLSPHDVVLAHAKLNPGGAPPCITLDDKTGVWLGLGPQTSSIPQYYCPYPKPHFYS